MKVYLKSYHYGMYLLNGSLDIPTYDIPHVGDTIRNEGRGVFKVVRRDYYIDDSGVVSVTLQLERLN